MDDPDDENHWVPDYGEPNTQNDHRRNKCDEAMSTFIPTKEPNIVRKGTNFCTKL